MLVAERRVSGHLWIEADAGRDLLGDGHGRAFLEQAGRGQRRDLAGGGKGVVFAVQQAVEQIVPRDKRRGDKGQRVAAQHGLVAWLRPDGEHGRWDTGTVERLRYKHLPRPPPPTPRSTSVSRSATSSSVCHERPIETDGASPVEKPPPAALCPAREVTMPTISPSWCERPHCCERVSAPPTVSASPHVSARERVTACEVMCDSVVTSEVARPFVSAVPLVVVSAVPRLTVSAAPCDSECEDMPPCDQDAPATWLSPIVSASPADSIVLTPTLPICE